MNHIVKSYDRDLEEVLGEVTAMGRSSTPTKPAPS